MGATSFADASVTVSNTQRSLVHETKEGIPTQATAGWISATIRTAQIAGDTFRVRVLGVSSEVLWESVITGVQSGPLVLPRILVSASGWDITALRTAGADAVFGVEGYLEPVTIAVDTIAANAITAAATAADFTTEIQSGLATAAGLTSATVNLDVAVSTRLAPTTPGQTLDVSAGGNAGIDWANIGGPNTVVSLGNTTIKTATDVETDTANIQTRIPAALVSGRIDASVGAMASDVLTAAATAADFGTEVATAVWAKVLEGAHTASDLARLVASRLLGKATIQTSDGTYTFRDLGDTKDRIVGAVSGTARTISAADGT